MGTSGSSGTTGSAGGSGCSASTQALEEHGSQMERESGSCDGVKGHTHPSHCSNWVGLQPELTQASTYHRSSGGMRLMRDFSSSAVSMESSVGGGEGPEQVCLDLSSQDFGAT